MCLHFGIPTLGYFTRVNFGVSSIFPTGTKASSLIAVLVLFLCKAILSYVVLFFNAEGIDRKHFLRWKSAFACPVPQVE